MKNITIYEKGTAKVLTQDLVNKHYSVYKVNLDSAEIAKIVKVNNNLEVYLKNGEKVVIDDFFIGEKPKEFTIETADGKHYLLNFLEFDATGTVTKIDYLGITDFQEYLVGHHSAVPAWAWVAAAAGAIGIAAASGGSGGSSHSEEKDQTKVLAEAEVKVKAAEKAYQDALTALNEAKADGIISQSEQAVLIKARDDAQAAKAAAQAAVDGLPAELQTEKDAFQDRIDGLTDITIPAVNDTDGNGIADDVDALIAAAGDLVAAAEQAYQDAQTALTAAQSDGAISQAEVDTLTQALADAQAAKADAQAAVDALPAVVQTEKDAFQDRIDGLTDITIPAVNDTDGNGIADDVDALIAAAGDLVAAAEQAYQDAQTALTAAQSDGAISQADVDTLTQALADAQAAKADAQAAVDALPAVVQTEKDAFQDRIDGLTDITIPAVNDTDGNGIADDVDALIAAAGDLVAAAEQAYQDAQTALTAAQSDNIITQGEFDALTQALADAQAAKADAQAAVDALPAVVQTEKDAFQDRIDGLTDITIPAVNDTDGNGIADDVDALIATAGDLVAAAEQAYQDAQTALTAAQSDNIITQGEFDALTQALADAQAAKAGAQAAVDALPAVVQTEKDALQDRIDDLTDISVPPVTPVDLNVVEDLVAAAEQAYQDAQTALDTVLSDGAVSQAEVDTLTQALADAQAAKADAQTAVDSLPAEFQTEKDAFQDRIDGLTDITIPAVNDTDGNGIADDVDALIAAAGDLVAAAEQAYQDAQTALAAAQSDGAISQAEVDTLTQALADAQAAKGDAQAAVDALPAVVQTEKDALQDRIDDLTDISVPPVTPVDLNVVEDLVAAAEQAYQDAQTALDTVLSDGAVSQAEVDTLTQALADAQAPKADAQTAVDSLPAEFQTEKDAFQDRIDGLTDITIPAVNDTDGNGIADDVDALIAAAGDLVAAAEQAYQDAQTALTAAQSDNIITQGEFDALTQALADAQAAKGDAQAAVDALPAVVQTEKDALQDRIDDLTDISVPPVTPVDLNVVEDLVAAAEQAYQDAQTALDTVLSDGAVSQAEVDTLTQALADAQAAKADAQTAVDSLPAEFQTEKDAFQDRIDGLTDITIPAVNDTDGNGIADDVDALIATAGDLVAAAEQAYQDAQTALTAAQSDNIITQGEFDALTQALVDAQAAKAGAQAAVDALPAVVQTEKDALQDRIDDLTDISVPPVTPVDLNVVEDLVAAAEQAYQDAQTALDTVLSDGAVSQAEVDTLTQALADAQAAKADAQTAVDSLPAEFQTEKDAFQDRIDGLTDITIPAVNDTDGNGIADDVDALIAAAGDLVAAAEQAYQDTQTALAAAQSDGAISQAEVDTLTQALADAQAAKADAQAAVDALPAVVQTEKDAFQDRIDGLTDITIPAVNDTDGNGIADDVDALIAAAGDLVAAAEQAYQDAQTALAAAQSDGAISQAEVDTLTQALADAQAAKADAQAAVDALPAVVQTEKDAFQDRIDGLTDITIPAVNDTDGNGIADDVDALIAAAGDLVAAAEQAYQDAQTALTAAQSDNIITQGEFDALTQALADAQAAKAGAQAAVDALPAVVQTEKDALQDRIDDLTDISVPPVTPVDLNVVEDLVAAAEQAYQDAQTALDTVLSDGAVSQAEVDTLTQALADAQAAKADAQTAVDSLPAEFQTEKDAFQDRIDGLTDITIPAVNDTDGNGIADDVDALIAAAGDLVAAAEQAYQDAQTALTAAQSDNIITQGEFDALTQALADAQAAKGDAQAAVDALPAVVQTEKDALQDRIDDLTDISVPPVTPVDLNVVEDLVAAAEQAYQDAQTALDTVLSDGAVSQAEVDTLTQALADAQAAKADAQTAVDSLPAEFQTEKDAFQDRIDGLTDITIPAVNDTDGNGIADDVDALIATAGDLVAAAEQAYQDAQTALTAAQSDNIITQGEFDALTQALADAQAAKAGAQAAVDALPAVVQTEKDALQDRIDDLTDISVPPVTPVDLNVVEDLVAAAEQAYQDAQTALDTVLSDGAVSQAEVDTLTQALADAQAAKADAQTAVDSLPAEFQTEKDAFQDRIDGLTDITIPAVNDTDGNGIADDVDALIAAAGDLVAAAEQAYQDAQTALTAAQSDNIITQGEFDALTQALADAQAAKADAQAAVDALPAVVQTEKDALQDRIDDLTDISVPPVTPVDLNVVEDLVAAAEQAYQDAQTALDTVLSDGAVSQAEVDTLTQALADAQAAKADAQTAVDSLPAEFQTEKDAFQDRIDGLTDITIPAVNDTDGNGIADDVDALIAAAGDLVAAAEQAYQDAQTALTAAQSDNIITQGEFDALTQALADAQAAKGDAQAAVDALPAVVQTEKDALQDRIDDLTDISVPPVTPVDLNVVEDLVAAAEQAYQDAQTALDTVLSDGAVSQAEVDTLTQALADAQAAKADAQTAVDSLPAEFQTEKDAFQDRIDGLTDITIPAVNDTDGNGIADDVDALIATAGDLVAAAEQAYQDAQTALTAAQSDNIITQGEFDALTQALVDAQAAKAGAQAAVDALPAVVQTEKDALQDRIDDLTDISVPPVTPVDLNVVEDLVAAAEQAYQDAQTALDTVLSDGAVSQAEVDTLTQALADAQAAKADAQTAVDSLPAEFQTEKDAFQDRIDGLTDITIPAVNDTDGNGIADDVDALIAAAGDLVAAAEQAYQDTQTALAAAQSDGAISQAEVDTLTQALADAQAAKADAQAAVDALPAVVQTEKDAFQDRIDGLTDITIPAVNDTDGNGIADDVDALIAAAGDLVAAAEQAYQDAQTALAAAQSDGAISQAEVDTLTQALADAQAAKADAQAAVDALPAVVQTEKDAFQDRIDGLTDITIPAVNDTDGNGIADDVDALIAAAGDLVAAAEQAYQDAQTALTAAQSDNIITQGEFDALTQALADAQAAKAGAQAAVDALPAVVQTEKDALQDRIDDLTDISVPPVTPVDLNVVEDLVAAAEQAYQDAQTALDTVLSDGAVSQAEVDTLTQALADAQAAKADAQTAVDSLPAEFQTEKDAFQDRIDGLTDITIPAVNDTDGNGIADDVDALIAAAGDLVAAAEQAYQDAQTALTAAQSDNIITQGEFDALTQALADAQAAKGDAQAAVDALPAVVQTEKDALQDRIDDLTDISVPPVTPVDLNVVEDLVAAAEQAYQDAQTALDTVLSDGAVSQAEVDTLTQALADAQAAKADAQTAVDSLPAEFQTEKDAFQDRIDGLTDITIPAVNDTDGNGIADDVDALIATAGDLVAAAEQAYQDAQTALTAAQSDNIITQGEFDALTQALADAQAAKAGAQAAVDALPAVVQTEKDALQDRIDDLTDISVPPVTPVDLNVVEDLVAAAEQAYQDAQTALDTVLSDGAVSQAEVDTLTQALADAQAAKADAQTAVDSLPAEFQTEKDAFQDRIDGLTDITIPAVNDTDGNGIADDVDALIAAAGDLVAAAEQAYQDAQTALTAAQSDNIITQGEFDALTQALADAQAAKADAQAAVDALPAVVQTEKDALQDRIDDLTDISVPPVTPVDLNVVEDLVAAAEQAYQDAQTALDTVLSDGAVSQAEVDTLTQALADAQAAKADAQTAVDSLPAEFQTEKDAFQDRIDGLTDITIPAVNDTDGNGIADDVDALIAAAGDLVAAAEQAYQDAQTALTAAQSDNIITQGEFDALTQALADAQAAKADAQAAVDALPAVVQTEKDALQDRIDDLTDISVPPVTPVDLNATDDEFALDLGQETRLDRTEVAGSDIAIVDILGNNATGLDFSIPQTTGSAGKGVTGNISVTVSQQDLISVGEAVQIVIYQQTVNGPVEVARGTSQGGIVTVGGIGIIGVVNSNDSIRLDFTNLPEGNYTVAVQADDSVLTTLLKDVALQDLGGEGAILGASNEAAIYSAINTVLGPLAAPVVALVQAILLPVNAIGLPLSSVVNQLLDVLPVNVIDYIVNEAVAPLLSNLLTIYEKTNISVTGTEEVFANFAVTGNVFADNGNGQDVIGGGSITEIDGASVAQGSVTIQGEYGSLEINTITGVFTYTVTAGESAIGKTEIFDYKLSNGTTFDTAQIIINIAGTPADPGELTPPDHVDQVVANDDLATVKNYQETEGKDVGLEGRASQLLGVNLLGLNISLGNTVPFNFEVEENSTSSIHVNVSGSVVSAAIGGLIGALLGTADKFFNAVLERQYVDENGVIQKEHFIVEDAVKLTPPGLLGIIFNYSGQINLDNLPPGVYTIALQEKPTDSGLLQQILNLLDSTASAQLFGGVELTMQDQTNKYLGSSTIEGNVISSVDGADEVNTTTFVTKVANEVGDPAVTLSGANTVVVGAYGTLYISPNGHYKYVSNGNAADIGKVDTFTYTIRDFNGSEATANLNIRIDGDNSGVIWDNTNPQNDVSLPAPIILDNAEHVAIGAVTNVHQSSTSNQGDLKIASGLLGAGGNGTYTPTTFSIANTDSAHVVVKVSLPLLSLSVAPTIVLTIKDQNGITVGTKTEKPLLAIGSVTVDMPNLGPGTYTITASATGNTGFGYDAAVTLTQDITHYNEIAPVTAAAITGNMLTDDIYNSSYAKFSIDTGNGQFVEVGYNGVTVQGEHGSLFVKSDGSYVYTPSADVIGRQEVFDYKLSVFGQDHTASLTVTVDAITTGDALRNTLISGELNDTFTGNGGSDVLVYHVLESASASGGNGVDHWSDFHSGNVNTDTNADIIDISDLLIGFNSANITADLTASANYLKNYLGVRVDGNNVTLTLDRDGAGTTYTGKTDLLQLDNLAQSGAAFNGKTEDDILKLLLQNHQLVL